MTPSGRSGDSGLRGRAAVVTGGGRGIGRAIAGRLARAGASVIVAARSRDEIEGVAEELSSRGGRAVAIPCDVTDPDAVGRLEERARQAFGTVDILVNNAGISSSSPLHRVSLDDWSRSLDVNATGPFLCTRAFLPGMLDAGWGRVVNVASVSGLRGGRYITAYASAKHAVVGFTRSLALEVAGEGVTVNAVCPAFVETEMTEESVDRIVEKTGRSREDARRALEEESPQDRLIRPEEVANAVHFLCGVGARGINGETLAIDGGKLAG